jgi:hypothetical protein
MTRVRVLFVGMVPLALVTLVHSAAMAGKIEGSFSSCDLSSPFSRCEWTPAGCRKPSPPYFFPTDAESYNSAVAEYNSYLDDVNRYLACIIADAKNDIANEFPEVVKRGFDQLSGDTQRDVDRAKDDLDAARLLLQRRRR